MTRFHLQLQGRAPNYQPSGRRIPRPRTVSVREQSRWYYWLMPPSGCMSQQEDAREMRTGEGRREVGKRRHYLIATASGIDLQTLTSYWRTHHSLPLFVRTSLCHSLPFLPPRALLALMCALLSSSSLPPLPLPFCPVPSRFISLRVAYRAHSQTHFPTIKRCSVASCRGSSPLPVVPPLTLSSPVLRSLPWPRPRPASGRSS